MRVLLLTRYERLGASSRLRSLQYLPYLRGLGHEIHVAPLLSNEYLDRLYTKRSASLSDVMLSYWKRFIRLIDIRSFSLVWIEYEAMPWVPNWLESLFVNSNIPFVVDYDDAVFHRYDNHRSTIVRLVLGKKIDAVMKRSKIVIAGNEYIAERAQNAGASRVEILPTAVDLDRYPARSPERSSLFTIGWIGTPRTAHYLRMVEETLRFICRRGETSFVAIGPSAVSLEGVPVKVRAWTEDTEVEELSRLDVGIMPLIDSDWERGKCGYKLLQYMACALPVVASPIGVNREIVEHGVNGYLASNSEEWIHALKALQGNPDLRKRMGQAGRQKVERLYSTSVVAPRLARLLEEAAQGDS